MNRLELVEKLQSKAHLSFEEAKNTLEENNWDLLDAIVALEREGKLQDQTEDPAPQTLFEDVEEEAEDFTDEMLGEAEEVIHEESAEEAQEEIKFNQTSEESAEHQSQKAEAKFTKAGEKISSWAESGNRNFLLISRCGKEETRIPMTVVVIGLLLILLFFPFIPLLLFAFVVSLFLGFRYNIVGPKDHSKVNQVMDRVNNTADEVKDAMKEEWDKISK